MSREPEGIDATTKASQPESLVSRWTAASRRYRTHAQLLWSSCPGWSLLALAATLVSAAMSTFMLIATGRFIGALPAAISAGPGSPAASHLWRWLVWTAAVLVGSPLLGAVTGWLRAVVSARYLVHAFDLVAETGTHPRGIAHLDTPGFSGRLHTLVQATRDWTFVFGLDSTWDVLQLRLAGLGAFVVLMSWRWWIPFVIAGTYVLQSKAFVNWLNNSFDNLFVSASTDRRRATYLRGLLTGADAAKEVRLFGLTGWLVSRYTKSWRTEMELVWRLRNRGLVPILVTCLAMVVAVGGALALLAHDVGAGAVSLASVVMLVQAMLGLESFGILGDQQTSLARNTTATTEMTRLRAEIGLPASSPAAEPVPATPVPAARMRASPTSGRPGATTARPARGAATVDFDDVTFAYPTRDAPTVRKLALHVPAGQSIAVVGVNGAGKSTLIKLACGLYPPATGTVRVGGGDPFADEAARRRVAVIFQDFVRYQLPLRDNVGFGAIDHRDDQEVLDRALIDAGGQDLLEQVEHGWDTVLSAGYEGGTDLSGGQWQRVALARALAAVASGAGVLVLDEPTAALDVRAEAQLFDRFLQVTGGVTTILVSHRLSSVRHADRIVVLDGSDGAEGDGGTAGAIVEDGTHAELMATGGRYAQMFTLQARRFAQAGAASTGPAQRPVEQ